MSSLGSVPKLLVDKGLLELLAEMDDTEDTPHREHNDEDDGGHDDDGDGDGDNDGDGDEPEEQQHQRQEDLIPRMSSQVATLSYLPSLVESDRMVNSPPNTNTTDILALLVSSTVADDSPGLFDGMEEVRKSSVTVTERSSISSVDSARGGIFTSTDKLIQMLDEDEFGDEEAMFAPREAFSKGAKGRISKAEAKFLMAGRLFGEEAQTMKPKVQHGQVGFRQASHSTSTVQQELEDNTEHSPHDETPIHDAVLETDASARMSAATASRPLSMAFGPEFWLELWDHRSMQLYYSNVLTGQVMHRKPRNLVQTTISLGGVTILCYAAASLKQVFAAMKVQRVWRARRDRLEAQQKRKMLLQAAEDYEGAGATKRASNAKSLTDAVIEGLHEAFIACHLSGPVKEECVEEDYEEKYVYELTGSEFKIMAPEVFKNIRNYFGVNSDEFHSSMRDQLKVMGQNAGRSGSYFFISANKKFILKSITKSEDTLLRTILPSYMEHIHNFPHTLLTRYFGLFHLRVAGKKIQLVAMSNVFSTCVPSEAYDLKGSFVNRTVLQPGEAPTPGKIMKDNDLKREMRLDIVVQNMLHGQLQLDTDWLASHDIMDYSLLLGVNSLSGPCGTSIRETYSGQLSRFSISSDMSSPRLSTFGLGRISDMTEVGPRSCSGHAVGASKPIAINPRAVSTESMANKPGSFRNRLRFPIRKKPSLTIIKPSPAAGDMLAIPPATAGINAFMLHEGGVLGENSATGQEEIYYIGIIDMLQKYNVNKKMERSIKRVTGKAGEGISSINSTDYATRFMRYMHSIFQ